MAGWALFDGSEYQNTAKWLGATWYFCAKGHEERSIMGSWNETCVITNLPIRSSEKDVKMVVFKPFSNDDYSLRRMVTDPDTMVKCFRNIFAGDYDDYGSLEVYQSIGDGFELPEDLEGYQYFFAKGDAWNAIVSYVDGQINSPDEYAGWEYKHYISCFKTCIWLNRDSVISKFPDNLFSGREAEDPDDIQISSWFTELLYVLAFLQNTRRDIWIGDVYRGCQTTNYEEHSLIAEQIKSQIIEGMKYDEE
jgi:hypothetical protein